MDLQCQIKIEKMNNKRNLHLTNELNEEIKILFKKCSKNEDLIKILLNQLQDLKISKIDLVKATSKEIDSLRTMIGDSRRKLLK